VSERRTTLLFLLVSLGVFAGLTLLTKKKTPPPPARPSWQRPVNELTEAQQRVYAELRARLPELKKAREQTGSWPGPTASAGHVINYVQEREGLRWLLLVLEPDPRLPREPPPPEDDEHVNLADGTGLHVTLWTQPLTEAPPPGVIAFPAAEGWVERVRGTPAAR
jgi:hypothetical protein